MRRKALVYTIAIWCAVGVLTLLSARLVSGQIEIPKEVDAYKLIPATLKIVLPPGAYLEDGGWEIIGDTSKQVPDLQDMGVTCVWTGTPGSYTVKFDGVILKDVKVKNTDGIEEVVRSYLGKAKGTAKCMIKGGGGPNPPDPPDPPTPGGKYRIVMFYSSDPAALSQLPKGQRDVLVSQTFRDYLISEGHVLLEVLDPNRFSGSVPDKWKPWVQSILGDPLPRFAIAPKDESGYVADYPVPNGIEAAKAFLKDPQRVLEVTKK